MATPLVTRESIQTMLDSTDDKYVEQVIGRALVALYRLQTEDERASSVTSNLNGIGFTATDAKSGSIMARTFMKYKSLKDWQIRNWTKKGTNGFARLCKYHRQLNEIALQKQR